MSLLDIDSITKEEKLPEDTVERFYKVHSALLFETYNKLLEWAPFSLILEAKTLMYTSYGDWSTHDLLFYLIRHIGPSNVYISTWAMGENAVRLLNQAKSNGLIKELYVVADKRLRIRNSGVSAMLESTITEMALTDCHAKVFVIEGERYSVVNTGSGNMTNNKRIESGVVSVDEEAVEFNKNWITREIKKGRERYEGLD